MPAVAIATCAAFPDLEDDDRLLLDALGARGIVARPETWTDASVDWSAYDLVLLRSTWDYSDDRDAFLAWCDRVAAVTTLLNPRDLVAWNTDKTYLRELRAAGIPVVPTAFLEPGERLDAWTPPAGCATFVVKPAVSAGSRDTMRHANDAAGADAARAQLAALHARGRTVMVQPYLDSVDADGETALLFLDGEYSHAIRKGQMLAIGSDGERVGGLYLKEPIDPREPAADERELADRVLRAIPGGIPLYARVDLIRAADGAPVLLELELCEPSLFFSFGEGSADRLAEAISRRLPAA